MNQPKDGRIRVLVVDDSAVVREVLARELIRDPAIVVVGTAADAYIAREKILKLEPDVITLDIEMPRMDGVTFLRKLMTHHPLRVIVLSSLAEPGAQAALDALALGAIDVLPKPRGDARNGRVECIDELIEHIKVAATAKLPERSQPARRRSARHSAVPTPGGKSDRAAGATGGPVIGIGASTGGTEAMRRVLMGLPADSPGVLAAIHMPEGFTRRYAERLNDACAMEVHEAVDGEVLRAGCVLLARGGRHLVLTQVGSRHIVNLRDGPPVNRHRPSIDVLFHSLVEVNGAAACGVLLTGMGADGADGLLAMRRAGAETIVQDEASCVVFGMPKVAIERNAAGRIASIDAIAPAIRDWSRQRLRRPSPFQAPVEPHS
ncbi:MAG: protein-glutamate methylesterase/protein-glutamine glutaminase [Planctomycetota bacterium]